MIRKTIPLILGCMLLLATVASCGKGDGASSGSDSITFSAKKDADTSSFKRSNGEICKVSVNTELSIPDTYKGKAIDDKFVKLFVTTALEGADSLDVDTAVKHLVANRLAENVSSETESNEEDDALATSNIQIDVKVYPVFNRNGILSMCFEETVKKDAVASVVHSYFNYDMEKCAVEELGE